MKQQSGISLSKVDHERMARLYEEVNGRLTEMALIVSRTLGIKLDEHTPRFMPLQDLQKARLLGVKPGDHVQILASPDGTSSACYVYSLGICTPCGDPECRP